MGLLSFFADRERKGELRESKDEMMVGEIVRAMSRKGWPTVSFRATDDFQRIKFRARGDAVLSSIYITLDRKTGSGAISAALLGSQATLYVTCEVKNYLADPDDLIHMYRTDLANLFKISWKEVRINHEYNAILGTSKHVINIDNYIGKGDQGVQQLMQFLDGQIQTIRQKIQPYKRA
ncbi:MAG: hypothetical protein AAFS10_19675 [Myxococcota bacterium]